MIKKDFYCRSCNRQNCGIEGHYYLYANNTCVCKEGQYCHLCIYKKTSKEKESEYQKLNIKITEQDKNKFLSQQHITKKQEPRNSFTVKKTVKGIYEVVTEGKP